MRIAASNGNGRCGVAGFALLLGVCTALAAGPRAETRRAGSGAFRKPGRPIAMIKEGFLWIDAEDFTDYGGWWLDTQFVHLMGSAYLIAAGAGKPVQDATVDVDIPQAGRYRLWVRARNWLKDHSPGTFNVVVGGVASKRVFGAADTEEWIWQSAGELDLNKGPTQIALRDLTGYYGRCDALLLTTDLAYEPPAKVEEIRKERSRLTGLALEAEHVGEFDVIVVGGGAAGCCAAIASARMGARTALIQNRPVLGGNASIECGVSVNGAASCHREAREGGIIEEAGRIKARYGYPRMSEPFRLAAEEEKSLSVFLNRHVFAVQMQDSKTLRSVQAVDTLTGAITAYRGKLFIDCTGDGWVGFFAGATYRRGRESRREFGESLAPDKADEITMSGCIMGDLCLAYRARDTGRPAPYTPPPWAPKFPSAQEFGRDPRGFTGGQWWLEHEGTIDDVYDAEKARDELIRITFGYWDWIKNTWPRRREAANYALTYVPITDAKRESRRLVGDHILTQNDVQGPREFPDRISYGGWPIDVHHPKGIYSGKAGPFHCNPRVPIYTIPFRCLYSVNIDNLLFAGRDISATHVALGTVRVQGTLSALGQAAGTAAALCLRHATTPRGLYRKHIRLLQQTLLKHDQYIPGLRNEDPLDLARAAELSASSTAGYEEFDRTKVEKARGDGLHPLNMPRAVMFPVGLKQRIDSIFLLLRSDNDRPTEVTASLLGAEESGDFSAEEPIATHRAAVPVARESWVEFRFGCRVRAPYAWVRLPKTQGLSWRRMAGAPLGSCRAYGGGPKRKWTVVKGQYYAFYARPALAIQARYRVENLTNGLTRIIGRETNMWASDPSRPMPQWAELSFEAPVECNTVYLTFDTDMNAPFHTTPLVSQCVRDYELSYLPAGVGDDETNRRSLARVKGNFQRRRVHRFETVSASKLRLKVFATHGDRSARVFEIRAYKE